MSEAKIDCEKDKPAIEEISRRLAENYALILSEFGVTLLKDKNKQIGCCPLHDGNIKDEFEIIIDGNGTLKKWRCKTHGCERTFCPSGLGLVRGLLSRKNFAWHPECNEDKKYSFYRAIYWSCDFLRIKWKNIKEGYAIKEQEGFEISGI